MSQEQQTSMSLEERVRQLEAENQALRQEKPAKAPASLTMKVSSKGGVSVYGLGRWPVTLYLSQWERLLEAKDKIETFCQENIENLAKKV